MRNRNIWGSFFWAMLGIFFCMRAIRYGFTRSGIPGAGLFPFLAGITLTCLSLVVLISTLLSKNKDDGKISREKFFPQRDSLKKVIRVLFSLFVYPIALGYLGFIMTTFLFMILLFRFVEPQRWIKMLTIAFLTSILSYIIFKLWLKVPLPTGILGI